MEGRKIRQGLEIGPVATLVAYACLLPQLLAVVLVLRGETAGVALALTYGAFALTFLGGIWWGMSMRCEARQPAMIGLSTLPIVTATVIQLTALATATYRLPLAALGLAVLLMLPVDDWLARRRQVPPGWMRLRIPLSIGFALLTFLVALLAPVPAGVAT